MEFEVLIAAAGVLPGSQRAVWPTKPCASVPDTPEMGSELADGDVVVVLVDVDGDSSDGVVVTVVVSGGGAASLVCGADPPPWSPETSTAASTTAAVNITMVAATNATCVVPNRGFLRGGAGGGIGASGCW
jgi:hypothetical protein